MSQPIDLPEEGEACCGEEEEECNASTDDSRRQVATSFWQAVQERRECSDKEAARDATALAERHRSKWLAIAFGQFIALIAASVNMTSFTLENNFGVVAPAFQLFLMYTFLSVHLCFRSQEYEPSDAVYKVPLLGFRIHIPWYLYFIVSCVDVGAGIIMLISLQYTSLTSVTLLGSLTVPSTMIFSKILLNKAFHRHHLFGVCFCLVGGCLTIWSDLDEQGGAQNGAAGNNTTDTTTNTTDAHTSRHILEMNVGDLLAVSAALLYGLGDAVSEYSIKHIDRMELLGMLGLFGMVLTVLQFPFQERDALSMLFGEPSAHLGAFLLMGSYVFLLLLYYVTEASFLVSSDATLLNLSLQAQNLWAVLFSVLANHAAPPLLFYLALLLVVIGVFVYEVGPSSDPVLHMTQSGLPQDSALDDSDSSSAASDTQRRHYNAQYDSIQQVEII